jgi:methionine-rich copper-binding protein CopC
MSSPKSASYRIHILSTTLLLSLGLATSAHGHANLVNATPAANSMAMPPPTELRLKFSEGIEIKFTKVKVMGPDKGTIEAGALKLDPNDNTVVIVPLMSPLPNGKYTVDWQALSLDGHKTKGNYSFESMR